MPSIKRFFFFSKKKSHGSKFHEYHGYDNLRHSTYPTSPTANHHQQQHPPPPHTLSHRQHLYPQQLIMQPPTQQPPSQSQVIQTTTASQCQCQQCTLQHQLSHHQSALSPQTTAPVQILAPQPQAQMPLQMQPQSPPQMQQQQCQQPHLPFHYHNPTHHYVSQQANGQVQSAAPMAQCVCQHCPYSQQQQLQHHHHHHQQHQFQQQQQQQQQVITGQQQVQHFDIVQANGMCQHQGSNNQPNQHPIHQQYHTYNHIVQPSSQVCPSHPPQQLAPIILSPSTPGFQQQPPQCQQQQPIDQLPSQQFQYHTIQPHQYQQQKQHQHQRVQSLHQQQSQTIQQFQYSHQQIPVQPIIQSQVQISQHQAQQHQQQQQQQQYHQQQQQQQIESRSHDFSRYANMQSLMNDSLQTQKTHHSQTKFQEHVYCNQKSQFTLPPYEAPPDYNTFMERRKMYAIEFNGQHMTHHSESLVLQRTKDSSYENLRTRFSPYGNLGIGRQEPGFTS